METTYRNPWHKIGRPEYGPAVYHTTARPMQMGSALVYERVKGHVWDVGVNGVCVTQRAGINGARRYVAETGL